jgi:acyl-CoA dehydrogenase
MTDSIVTDTVAAILTKHLATKVYDQNEHDGWLPGLWSALAEGGFTAIGIPESVGGSGGGLTDVCDLLIAAGAHAVSLPLVESTLLGGWALTAAGLSLPAGPVTAAVGELSIEKGAVTGTLSHVPWAARADLIVTVADGHIVALRPGQVRIEAAHNLAGERQDRVYVDQVTDAIVAPAPPGVTIGALRCRGALGYAAMMAGAMDRIRDMTVRYTGQRHQFGRPVARFQAVGALLVRIAEEAAVSLAAVRAAASCGEIMPVAAASAKIVAGQAAATVTAAAHEAHGAIGMTREYELGQLTRRLWAWRENYGAESEWSRLLGRIAADAGAEKLWPIVVDGR